MYDLRKDGVTSVIYPDELRAQVAESGEAWKQFCELPESVKNLFEMQDRHSGVGYERSDATYGTDDKRESFDYSLAGLPLLEIMRERSTSETVHRFFKAAQKLGELSRPMIEGFGEKVEKEYGVSGFSELAASSAEDAFFRFLHYPATGNLGEIIAAPHTDHSGFTFHLYETTDGCEMLNTNKEWKALPLNGDEATVFASMQTQLFSNGEIKALPHRVISNEASAQAGRFAIVCFVALQGIPRYDKATHGSLQKQAPGFNYDLSFEEFSKLFKSKS